MEIYPRFAQNSEPESLGERSKRVIREVDLIAIRDPNILLVLINSGGNVRFFNSVIDVFRD